MKGADEARERTAFYRFLAEAYLRPPDAAFLGLAGEVLEPFPEGDLASLHSWLFDFNVYPYASVYLDPSGMLSAPWSDFVAGVYRALGLELKESAGLAAADHLAAELEAVAILLERESESEGALEAERARHGQRALLLEQLLPWLPTFSRALARADDGGFYGRLGKLTLGLALEHAAELAGDGSKVTTFSFKGEGELLSLSVSKKNMGTARSALQALITPARSGMFLSREDMKGLARSLGLPIRFAERAFMLESLVGAAADRGRLGELFTALRRAADEQLEDIVTLQGAWPELAAIWGDWRGKLEATANQLEALAKGEGKAT